LFFIFLPIKEHDKHADNSHRYPYNPEKETTLKRGYIRQYKKGYAEIQYEKKDKPNDPEYQRFLHGVTSFLKSIFLYLKSGFKTPPFCFEYDKKIIRCQILTGC
jgi:hypothetical protein